ncbi:hypothetical protein HYH03_006625 [Edaphochlamys debaryana]|uniref:Uncharacterized protein n=2 Tax=Edaphochlamys debaryana TaxID=47281 RepID=A0A836C0Z1_9CHLO|nr:hypothetical protein HYH03_006625 [Edaphochlamys debaryana]|eukprot:KAG2495357.1 hypothetical protein HYH03_006625 [Edaphochlamys debaryana]
MYPTLMAVVGEPESTLGLPTSVNAQARQGGPVLGCPAEAGEGCHYFERRPPLPTWGQPSTSMRVRIPEAGAEAGGPAPPPRRSPLQPHPASLPEQGADEEGEAGGAGGDEEGGEGEGELGTRQHSSLRPHRPGQAPAACLWRMTPPGVVPPPAPRTRAESSRSSASSCASASSSPPPPPSATGSRPPSPLSPTLATAPPRAASSSPPESELGREASSARSSQRPSPRPSTEAAAVEPAVPCRQPLELEQAQAPPSGHLPPLPPPPRPPSARGTAARLAAPPPAVLPAAADGLEPLPVA